MRQCAILFSMAIMLHAARVAVGDSVIDVSAAGTLFSCGAMKVMDMEPFYIASSDWRTLSRFGDALEKVAADGAVVLQQTKKNAAISGEVKYTASENGFTAELSATIAPNTGADYAVWDVYLPRALFADATAATASGPRSLSTTNWETIPAERVTITTAVGDWSFTLRSSAGYKWQLRSVCNRPWGPEERKTFTFLNQVEKIPAEGMKIDLSIEMKFVPNRGYDPKKTMSEIAAVSMKKLSTRYGFSISEENAPADAIQRADSYAKRIVSATADLGEDRIDPKAGVIIPEPKSRVRKSGVFAVPNKVAVACADEHTAALEILTLECARFGTTVNRVDPTVKVKAPMLIGIVSKDASVAAACARLGIDTNAFARPEGYAIAVTPTEILIAGSGPRGVLYGAQTLRQMMRSGNAGAEIPAGVIIDWPDQKFRGYYLEGGATASREDMFRLIRDVYSYYKANVLMYEIRWPRLKWRSHPELSVTNALEVSDLAVIAEYARTYKMRFIPAVFTYGKVNDLLKTHPDIAEDAEAAKMGKAGTYCPNNPASYALIFDLFQELIDTTKCDAIHIGHDEIKGMVACDTCKAMAPADLFANDVNKIDGFLAERNVESMVWGDFLLEAARWSKLGVKSANSGNAAYGGFVVHPAVEKMNKNIIICDWHYNTATNYPTFAYFAENGFRVIGCPWYHSVNNYHVTKAIQDIGQLGVLVTDWGFFATRSPSANSVLGAAYAWNCAAPEPAALTWYPQAVFGAAILDRDRPSRKFGAQYKPVNIDAAANRPLSGAKDVWIGNDGADLTYLPRGNARLFGVDYRIGEKGVIVAAENAKRGVPAKSTAIAVNTKAKSLVFLHGVSVENPSVYMQQFGNYRITYASKNTVDVPINSMNAVHWITEAPRLNPWGSWPYQFAWKSTCAWEGVNRRGDAVNLQAYEWVNTRPDDAIVSVEVQAKNAPGLMIGLVALTAVQ